MGAEIPKQYLPLAGRSVLEHSLARLAEVPAVRGIVVGLAPGDTHFSGLAPNPKLLATCIGGAERSATVRRGLECLRAHAGPEDWVLVHDAARPCVRVGDIEKLLAAVAQHPDGGILGTPVTDTMKRTDAHDRIVETVPRVRLWRGLTPQAFRLQPLLEALVRAERDGVPVTDEASAMEHAGARPIMVAGHPDNIKITVPEDLVLAERLLSQVK